MKHLPWKLLGAAVVLGIAFDILFFNIDKLGINVLLMQILLIAVTMGLARLQDHPQPLLGKEGGRTLPRKIWIPATYALAFAATFAIWTSDVGTTLSVVGLLLSNFYFFLFAIGHHGKYHHPFGAVGSAFSDVAGGILNRLNILAHLKLPGKTDTSTNIVRGVLIAIPVLAIFSGLFLASDLVLQAQTENLVTHFDKWVQNGKIIGHTFTIVIISLFFLGFFGVTFWRRIDIPGLKELAKRHHIESTVVLGTSVLLFLGFILFQSYYLFGGQLAWNNIQGITYSEYAVQGFNELATVAALVILLILSVRYFHTERTTKFMKILECALIGETFLIIVSAWMRMWLYIEQYGFTSARLFGLWFFIVTTVLLGLFAYNILRERPQYKYIQAALIFCGAAMLIFTASAPDALSVRLNMARATDDELYDPTPHLEEISAEAYPIATRALELPLRDVDDLRSSDKATLCAYVNDSRAFRDTYGDDDYFSVMAYFDTVNLRDNWEKRWLNDGLSVKYPSGRQNYGGKGPNDRYYVFKWQTWNLSRSKLPTDFSIKPNTSPGYTNYYIEFRDTCEQ